MHKRIRQLLSCCLFFCFSIVHAQIKNPGLKDSIVNKNDTVQRVEIEASVSRNLWIKHLESFLQPIIEGAASKGMKKGIYVVHVRFLVEKDGTINSVEALNNPGYGLAKGSEDAVKNGPLWIPGMINGLPVRSYHTQNITYVIE